MDPVEVYGSESATTCIAVHHAATQVADMHAVAMMRLEHLQCLCANCHRLGHQMLRDGTHVKKQQAACMVRACSGRDGTHVKKQGSSAAS